MLRDTPPTPLPFPSTDNLTSLPPFADSTEHHPPLPSLHYSTNTMDDIFTSSPPPSPTSNITTQHPSDIPHLRSTHSTAGYRDGIAASKEQYIQSGFDEGYALGAVLGLRVGWILGVLEGLYAALTSKTNRGAQGREREIVRVRGLLRDARRELKTEGVFGDEWFGADGIWRFDVNKGRGGDEEGEVTFEEVTDGHPLIGKWTGILEREVERCGVDLRVFEGEEWERGRVDGEGGLG